MKVNGIGMQLGGSLSLLEFLHLKKFQSARIAVERNGEIVPKTAYPDTMLTDEDVLEIVSFVGGG